MNDGTAECLAYGMVFISVAVGYLSDSLGFGILTMGIFLLGAGLYNVLSR